MAEAGQPARASSPDGQRRQQQHRAVAGVGEHHPEHDHVGHAGDDTRIDVGVGHGGVGLHQRGERAAGSAVPEQRGRLDTRRPRQRDGGTADPAQPAGQCGQLRGGRPPGQRGHAAPGQARRRVLLQLRLAGEQIGTPVALQRVEVGPDRAQRRCRRGGMQPGEPAGCLARGDRRVGRRVELDGAGGGHPDEHVPDRVARRHHRDPLHAHRLGAVMPRHRRPRGRVRRAPRTPARRTAATRRPPPQRPCRRPAPARTAAAAGARRRRRTPSPTSPPRPATAARDRRCPPGRSGPRGEGQTVNSVSVPAPVARAPSSRRVIDAAPSGSRRPATNSSRATSSAPPARAHGRAGGTAAATRSAQDRRSAVATACGVSPPGSPQGDVARTARSSAGEVAAASRLPTVARLPSRYSGAASCPPMPRSNSSTFASSNQPPSTRSWSPPPRGSQPANTRRFQSSVSPTARCACASVWSARTFCPYGVALRPASASARDGLEASSRAPAMPSRRRAMARARTVPATQPALTARRSRSAPPPSGARRPRPGPRGPAAGAGPAR